jgi:alpha-glucosidase
MQWDAARHGGFTTGTPWLPLADDAIQENVQNLAADAGSILTFYRTLIELRRRTPQLVSGRYVPVVTSGDLLAYRRELSDRAVLIVLNLSGEPVSVASDRIAHTGEILLSTNLDRTEEKVAGGLDLRGNEGLIIQLS